MPPKKKKRPKSSHHQGKGELVFKDEHQHYCIALKALGDRRFQLLGDEDAQPIVGKLRGNMRRSQFVTQGTIVLVADRVDDDSRKVDILMRYTDVHVRMLRKYGELDDLDACVAQYERDNALGGGPSVAESAENDGVEIVFEEDIDALIDGL
jgi:initiation factor 1A